MTRSITSTINYSSINENFPVAGEDNDTQTFRDNFDTIKTNFRSAHDDLVDVKTNAAFTDADVNFNNNIVSNAVFSETKNKKLQGGLIGLSTTALSIDFQEGHYQIFKIVGASPTKRVLPITFDNFPQNSNALLPLAVGKITLELTTDGLPAQLSITTTNGTNVRTNGFTAANGYSTGYQGNIELSAANSPVIVEVWRHNAENIFINYIGQFN